MNSRAKLRDPDSNADTTGMSGEVLLQWWDAIIATAFVVWCAVIFRRWISSGVMSFEMGSVVIRRNEEPRRFWRNLIIALVIAVAGLALILSPRVFGA